MVFSNYYAKPKMFVSSICRSIAFFVATILALVTSAASKVKAWRGIVPLHFSRVDKFWLILLLPIAIACSSERMPGPGSQSPKDRIIKIEPNQKYKLEAVFSGTDVEVGDRTVPVIQQLTLRSTAASRAIKYSPVDGPSDSDAEAYFIDVWSPDDEFIVLPLNRFHGFCIVRAAEAIDIIQKQSCSDTIRVRGETGTGLWHTFEKWDGDESFIFKVGLSGNLIRLKYDISQGRLTALEPNFRFLEGQNGKGKVQITRRP